MRKAYGPREPRKKAPLFDTCAWCTNWQRPNSMRRVQTDTIAIEPARMVNQEKEPICEFCYERHCIRKRIPYVSITGVSL